MAHCTTPRDTLNSIVFLSGEQQRLWAKGGGSEKLSEAERGRLIDIRRRLAELWDLRRLQLARARRAPRHVRARGAYRPGRAEWVARGKEVRG